MMSIQYVLLRTHQHSWLPCASCHHLRWGWPGVAHSHLSTAPTCPSAADSCRLSSCSMKPISDSCSHAGAKLKVRVYFFSHARAPCPKTSFGLQGMLMQNVGNNMTDACLVSRKIIALNKHAALVVAKHITVQCCSACLATGLSNKQYEPPRDLTTAGAQAVWQTC